MLLSCKTFKKGSASGSEKFDLFGKGKARSYILVSSLHGVLYHLDEDCGKGMGINQHWLLVTSLY